MSLNRFACWKSPDANEILRTEALQGHESIFLAVHTPMQGFEVEKGTRSAWLEHRTERGFLDALNREGLKHVFAVVEGEPGAGKSHLIRWLKIQWQHQQDLVLLIQRAEGSLDGTLRQIRNELAGEFADHFTGLGEVQQSSLEGRAKDFLSKLANRMDRNSYERESELPTHHEFVEDKQFSRLLHHDQVRSHWGAPRRIMGVVSGEGERNSALADFRLQDIAELAALANDISEVGMRPIQLLRALGREAKRFQPLLEEGLTQQQIYAELGDEVRNSRILVEALNARLNSALQGLLGISLQGLKDLFRRVRRTLKQQGRRLVLLLEDITSFQGVDDQLIDVLVEQSETAQAHDICDLISVVGITPDYLNNHLRRLGNIQDRITFHIRLSTDNDGSFQEVSGVRTPEERLRFAATYLRAVRSGVQALEEWHSTDLDAPVPNACDRCPLREQCHHTFGAVELSSPRHGATQAVGLYPFTSEAINRIFLALHDPRADRNLKTPRGVLQQVLAPSLLKPEAVERGVFPPPDLEGAWLPDSDRLLLGRLHSMVQNLGGDEATRERLRRLIAWWGDRSEASTREDVEGHVRFAGVRKQVYETFELPWLGAAEALPPKDPPTLPAQTSRLSESTTTDLVEKTSGPSLDRDSDGGPRAPKTPTKSPPARKSLGRTDQAEFAQRSAELKNWQEMGRLDDGQWWDARAYELVESLPWRRLGISAYLQEKLFTQQTVALSGSGRTDSRHFVIPSESWVRDGLESHIQLRVAGDTVQDAEFHRRRVARFLRRLARLAQSRVAEVVPSGADGGRLWSVPATATQVLLARAWMRGTASPKDSTSRQWRAVVEKEAPAEASAKERVDSWTAIVQKTSGSHATVREALLHWVNLPQATKGPTAQNVTFLDAEEAAPALLRLVQSGRLDAFPPAVPRREQTAILERLADLAKEVQQRLPQVARRERERLLRLCDDINQACRGGSLPDYIGRVVQVLNSVTKVCPSVPPGAVNEWLKVRDGLRESGVLATNDERGQAVKELDDFLADAGDSDIRNLDGAELLAWAQKAPAKELGQLWELTRSIEASLEQIGRYAEELVLSSGTAGAATLTDVQQIGERLMALAQELEEAIR